MRQDAFALFIAAPMPIPALAFRAFDREDEALIRAHYFAGHGSPSFSLRAIFWFWLCILVGMCSTWNVHDPME